MPRPIPRRAINGNQFEQAGFTRSNSEVRRRLIMAIDGATKSGKSHFALTAPEPICVINHDFGLEGVVEKFQSDKDIYVLDVPFNVEEFRNMDPKRAAQAADDILKKIKAATQKVLGQARTVIVDKATETWELVRLSHFGKLDQVKPHHYVFPNREYREFIRQFYDQAVTSLILLHDIKDEYIENERTGVKERAGFKETGGLVQCNAFCYRDATPGQTVPDCFHMEIMDCRQDASLAGVDISGADLNFPALAAMIFPSTKEEDWL